MSVTPLALRFGAEQLQTPKPRLTNLIGRR
jgi:hypothetical protein